MNEDLATPHIIVTWVWRGEARAYDLSHAARLDAGLRRFMTEPYRLVVFSDVAGEIPSDSATVVPIPRGARAVARVKTPEARNFPSSYRRLWLFSEEARELGSTVLMVDVDVIVTGDWSHLFRHQPEEDFMGWRPGQLWGNQENRVGGGVWRLRTGSHPEVWTRFLADPQAAIQQARTAGYRGSDQAWISYMLATDAPVWPNSAGIRSVRDFHRDRRGVPVQSIPEGTCMVHFNGYLKPWQPAALTQHPWLAPYLPGATLQGEEAAPP